MTALSFIQPLNESGFVGAVVSGPAVKVQCLLTFGAGEQHHFVAIVGLGNLSGVIQALGGVALSGVLRQAPSVTTFSMKT